jgi:hypothetical protein
MADKDMGNAAIDRAGDFATGYTLIDLLNPSDFAGKLYKVDVFAGTGGSFKIKVFRDDGSNYVLVSSETVTLASGLNTFTLATPVSVLVGDLMGGSNIAPTTIDQATSGGNLAFLAGDLGTTAKASFTVVANIISIYGYIKAASKGGLGFGNPMIF